MRTLMTTLTATILLTACAAKESNTPAKVEDAPAMEILCHRIDTPPVIDGDLSDPAWQAAVPAVRFHQLGSDLSARIETVAAMLYDDHRLYLGVLTRKHLGEKMSGRIWTGDNVELFLDPGRTREHYFQLAANHREKFAAGPGGNTAWKSEMEVAIKELPYGWSLEMSVPFSAMEVETPVDGETWGANICRSDSAHGQATFALLRGRNFHQPRSFAGLRFVAAPSGAMAALAQQAGREAAAAETRHAALTNELNRAIAGMTPANPGLGLLRESLDEHQNLARTAMTPEQGDNFFFLVGMRWLLDSSIKEMTNELAWQVKTAALFNK